MNKPPDQMWGTTVPGLEALGGLAVNAVESYERTLKLVQLVRRCPGYVQGAGGKLRGHAAVGRCIAPRS